MPRMRKRCGTRWRDCGAAGVDSAAMIRYVLIGVGIVALIPIAWLAWWLLSPLWMDTEVAEEFPRAVRAAVPDNMTMAEVEETMAAAAAVADRVMAEAMPETAPASGSRDATPQALLTGEFRGADRFHQGSGNATIYQLGADDRVLRLDDFRVTNGPDLRVLLVNAPNPESHSDLTDAGYVELGELKGNVGSQNYDIRGGVDWSRAQSVVIYCNPFRVVFSVATLAPPG